jgi:hypothetical protein
MLNSTFTILFQDTQSGLEFGDRKTGEFIPATAKEGVLYMNFGDMGQRISNGDLFARIYLPLALYLLLIRLLSIRPPSGCHFWQGQ